MKKTSMRNKVNSKFFDLIQYKEFQASGGAVDKSNLKTIWLQLRTHLFADNDNGPEELKLLFFGIRQTINKALDYSICDKKFIHQLDFSETFRDKPYTYIIMDFTFYPNDFYTKQTYTQFLDELVKKIHRDNITSSPFKFYAKKQDYKIEGKDINSI